MLVKNLILSFVWINLCVYTWLCSWQCVCLEMTQLVFCVWCCFATWVCFICLNENKNKKKWGCFIVHVIWSVSMYGIMFLGFILLLDNFSDALDYSYHACYTIFFCFHVFGVIILICGYSFCCSEFEVYRFAWGGIFYCGLTFCLFMLCICRYFC